jgi:RNA polymerase sigma-70 factor, ECF subfamily
MLHTQVFDNIGDDQLIARVLRGERDSFGALVTRHQDAIYRHMRGMGLDHDTSVDLVQDSFVKAYQRLSECRNPSQFRAWVFRIARNLCLDYLKNVRRMTVPLSEVSTDVAQPEQSDTELTITLQNALDTLPLQLREAFLLKHDAGYTYDEIAEMTDASASAVKMRVHRAGESLRAFLSARGVNAA